MTPTPTEDEAIHVCTAADPWTRTKSRRADHPDAVHLRDEYDQSADHDDYAIYECPHCGLTFAVTLPN